MVQGCLGGDLLRSLRGGIGRFGVRPPRVPGPPWDDDAPLVRTAYRDGIEPSDRDHYLGFRCAEFRQGVVSGARQGSEAEGAEQPGDRDPTSAAARPREDDGLSVRSN